MQNYLGKYGIDFYDERITYAINTLAKSKIGKKLINNMFNYFAPMVINSANRWKESVINFGRINPKEAEIFNCSFGFVENPKEIVSIIFNKNIHGEKQTLEIYFADFCNEHSRNFDGTPLVSAVLEKDGKTIHIDGACNQIGTLSQIIFDIDDGEAKKQVTEFINGFGFKRMERQLKSKEDYEFVNKKIVNDNFTPKPYQPVPKKPVLTSIEEIIKKYGTNSSAKENNKNNDEIEK